MVEVKEAMARRIQTAELRQRPWGPTPLSLDALAVLDGTAADQVSREMKYLTAELAIVREDRAQVKAKTGKTDENSHPPGIMTKPLQGKKIVFKRGRLLSPKVTPPVKSDAGAAPAVAAGKAKEKDERPPRCHRSRPRHMGPGAPGAVRPGAPLGPAQARTSG